MKTPQPLLTLIACMLLLSACAGRQASQQAAPLNITPQVSNIEILKLDTQPVQVRVVVSGRLPDGCTMLEAPKIERLANTFAVILTATRPAQPECPATQVDFERVVPLDVSRLTAGNYIVTVNGITDLFELAAQDPLSGEVAQVSTPAPLETQPPSQPTAALSAALENPTPAAATPVLPNTASQPANNPSSPVASPGAQVTQAPAPANQNTESAAPEIPASVQQVGVQQVGVQQAGFQPAASGQSQAAGSGSSGCTDIAALFSESIDPQKDTYYQGDAFVKTWELHNEGTCTWDENYSLVFANGDLMGGTNPLPLPKRVAPGDSVDIVMKMTAPLEGGTRGSNWLLRNGEGKTFGTSITGDRYIFVQMDVSYVAPTGTPVQSADSCTVQRNTSYENEVLSLINNLRVTIGLNPLNSQGQLNAAALQHSIDMACHDYSDHVDAQNMDWFGRIKAQGYTYATARENIYNGDPTFGGTPQGAMDWWKNSFTHLQNMLATDITDIGIGFVLFPDRKASDNTYSGYYTVDFASHKP